MAGAADAAPAQLWTYSGRLNHASGGLRQTRSARATVRAMKLVLLSTTALLVTLAAGGVAVAQSAANPPSDVEERVERVETRSNNLFAQLFGRSDEEPRPRGDVGQGGASDLSVRLDRIESQMRQLTGAVEQMQYRNQQLEQQLKRLAVGRGLSLPGDGSAGPRHAAARAAAGARRDPGAAAGTAATGSRPARRRVRSGAESAGARRAASARRRHPRARGRAQSGRRRHAQQHSAAPAEHADRDRLAGADRRAAGRSACRPRGRTRPAAGGFGAFRQRQGRVRPRLRLSAAPRLPARRRGVPQLSAQPPARPDGAGGDLLAGREPLSAPAAQRLGARFFSTSTTSIPTA